MLCYAMLCYAMLCYAMLYNAFLFFITSDIFTLSVQLMMHVLDLRDCLDGEKFLQVTFLNLKSYNIFAIFPSLVCSLNFPSFFSCFQFHLWLPLPYRHTYFSYHPPSSCVSRLTVFLHMRIIYISIL